MFSFRFYVVLAGLDFLFTQKSFMLFIPSSMWLLGHSFIHLSSGSCVFIMLFLRRQNEGVKSRRAEVDIMGLFVGGL